MTSNELKPFFFYKNPQTTKISTQIFKFQEFKKLCIILLGRINAMIFKMSLHNNNFVLFTFQHLYQARKQARIVEKILQCQRKKAQVLRVRGRVPQKPKIQMLMLIKATAAFHSIPHLSWIPLTPVHSKRNLPRIQQKQEQQQQQRSNQICWQQHQVEPPPAAAREMPARQVVEQETRTTACVIFAWTVWQTASSWSVATW